MSAPRRSRGARSLAVLGALVCASLAGCLAAPPPILVSTPFGDVRAASTEKATEVAGLLAELAPRVQQILPGAQHRSIDVWVQPELRVYRNQSRPESVRGFTLLSDEFDARRIHLVDDGQSSWYLSHELVHALIGSSWRTLPGVLEEGLGDVVAELLNPGFADHIRAHRLLNTAVLTEGFELGFAFGIPEDDRPPHAWRRASTRLLVRPDEEHTEAVGGIDLRELLATPRSRLHRRYPEIPEALYGFAWLMTSRIVERRGLEGLHALCERAQAEGLELVPPDWLAQAAGIDLDRLDPAFLGSCFGRREVITAVYLQTEAFARLALEVLQPLQPAYRRGTLTAMSPALQLADGSEVSFRALRPLSYGVYRSWRMDGHAVPASAARRSSGAPAASAR